jgi:hypothetical protein
MSHGGGGGGSYKCGKSVTYYLNGPLRLASQQSGSIQDQEPLTPNSFVLGDLANAIFPPNFPEERFTNLDNMKLKQQVKVQKAVWKQFFLEFVPLLGPRQKWSQEQENINVDDVVIELNYTCRC